MAEWLRRLTRNQMGSSRASSNLADCVGSFYKKTERNQQGILLILTGIQIEDRKHKKTEQSEINMDFCVSAWIFAHLNRQKKQQIFRPFYRQNTENKKQKET